MTMPRSSRRRWRSLLLPAALLAGLGLGGCGDEAPDAAPDAAGPTRHLLLGAREAVVLDGMEGAAAGLAPEPTAQINELRRKAREASSANLVVDYPFDGTVFPPGFVPPTFLWHDESEEADTWLVELESAKDTRAGLAVVIRGMPPPAGEIDERALGPSNDVYQPTPYQASASSWTPEEALWGAIQERARGGATLRFTGFSARAPDRLLSSTTVHIETSPDPVGAPIFYRDVPLMPALGEKGRIQPLGKEVLPLIGWRLKDVTRPDSRLVLTNLPTCANCHSFSEDGSTFGMDVDGPDGDKGAYTIVPVSEEIVVDYDTVITWNSFPDKPENHRTIGFLSRVSPDGRYVITTLNEELYVANFLDYRFLQVFFPTRGILAYYDTKMRTMKALPGADDPEFVHCAPVWTPDGQTIVFARAPAQAPYEPGRPVATHPNDPNETRVLYDLYRMAFNGGKGGVPEAIPGASANGMSNTFPKITPDGRWLVYVKCRNGQLMRPDSRLWILPLAGGEAREMECNLPLMNSWHSFSPNSRWMVWSSKSFTPYTQMFLTHLDEEGRSSPAVLIPNATAANRAVNLPEFLNRPFDDLKKIEVPALTHHHHFYRGTRALEQGRPREAIPHLRKALELEPDFCHAHVNLAFALLGIGQRKEAFEHLERAVKINPEDPFALTNMGVALYRTNRLDEALQVAHDAVAIAPRLAITNNLMGQILTRQGKLEEALPFLREAAAAKPPNWHARRNCGLLLLELGELEEGIRMLEEVQANTPDDPALRRALDRARSELGR